ncbi:PatB family C-S lyase [Clostridium malenominatum]|uniref:cysteine-S-conjugate beta-lyase n=1 Tax=Clostridium malenominatum TaxID=1539 RepID=A0ABP3TUN8_9CLOT
MKYDFDAIIDRSNMWSVKYDEAEKKFGTKDLLQLWIADMEFKTSPEIIEAMKERAEHGIFGYTSRKESYDEAILNWQKRRNGWEIDKDLMSFSPGVIPALVYIVNELSEKGDKVLLLSPVYSEFFTVINDWNREVVTSSLKEVNSRYEIDFDDFEKKVSDGVKLFILCNPHNPVGRVWSVDELKKLGDICVKYGVTIVSDEIHSDLNLFNNKHTVMATVSKEIAKNTITCFAPTKTFNLAGIQASSIVFPNKEIKEKYDEYWGKMDIRRNNCFSAVAVEVAYDKGEEWLKELIPYIENNMKFVKKFLDENIPKIKMSIPESTYLIWLDCRELGMNPQELNEFMVKKAGLGLNNGTAFGEDGAGFMRLNAACSIKILEKAMNQLKVAVDNYLKIQ